MVPGHWSEYRKCAHFLAKFFFVREFFLQSTTAPWFWRATEDVLINFPLLPGFIRSLNRRCDALGNEVYMGNCISLGRPYVPFMQGGSGYLMSHRAVGRDAPFSRYFVLHSRNEDDPYVGWFVLTMLTVTASETTSHRFIGYKLTINETNALLNKDFSKFPPCPNQRRFWNEPDGCSWFVKPIRGSYSSISRSPISAKS
jgi:hypothetical protein